MKLALSARPFLSPIGTSEMCTDLGPDKVDIRVHDKITNEELARVNITYNCLSTTCNLGATKADFGVNRLRTNLPAGCANPKLIATRDDYISGETIMPTQAQSADIYVVPTKKMQFNITKIISINQNEVPLSEGDVVLVTIKNAKYNFEQNLVYPDITGGNLSDLSLIYGPATYSIEMFLSTEDKFVGGWEGNWSVSAQDIFLSNKVIFPVYEKVPYPSTDQELFDMFAEINSESSKYPPRLE
jgi:hypothetical protein